MNLLSKIIYNLSTIIPLLFTFALTWYIQKSDYIIPLAMLGVGVVLLALLIFMFKYGKNHISSTIIRVTDISPNDSWLITYVIAYMLPFANIVFDDFNFLICAVIAAILLFLLPVLNDSYPNPLLFLGRYHFYQISTENGVSGYLLLSKRKLRRKQDVKVIGRMFEYLLLDMEE